MIRKLIFVVALTLALMASFSVVLADQNGNARWCNSDQYGCWITNEKGGQDYIMFWSEYARTLFMGKDSTATVAPPVPSGKMKLKPAPEEGPSALELKIQSIKNSYYKDLGYQSPDQMTAGINNMLKHGMTVDEIEQSIKDYLNNQNTGESE